MGGPMRMNPPRGMGGMGPQVGVAFSLSSCSGSCGRLGFEMAANDSVPSAVESQRTHADYRPT